MNAIFWCNLIEKMCYNHNQGIQKLEELGSKLNPSDLQINFMMLMKVFLKRKSHTTLEIIIEEWV